MCWFKICMPIGRYLNWSSLDCIKKRNMKTKWAFLFMKRSVMELSDGCCLWHSAWQSIPYPHCSINSVLFWGRGWPKIEISFNTKKARNSHKGLDYTFSTERQLKNNRSLKYPTKSILAHQPQKNLYIIWRWMDFQVSSSHFHSLKTFEGFP